MEIDIDKSWKEALHKYIEQDNFKALIKRVLARYKEQSKTIYPHPLNIFKSLNETPFNKVRVVILGQDPYHGERQAHGLAFSVPNGIKAPPSLKNIFKELESDTGIMRTNTDLTDWAEQGVLLLNSVLTVEAQKAASHSDIGWQDFTDTIIKTISHNRENIVFILWGAYAQSKKNFINENKHLILEAPHPSPLSSYRGFFGCQHFSKVSTYLKQYGEKQIKW